MKANREDEQQGGEEERGTYPRSAAREGGIEARKVRTGQHK